MIDHDGGRIIVFRAASRAIFKGVLRPGVKIVGVLRPGAFWRPRPRPITYGVLRLTVFWRQASGVKFQASGVLVSLKIEFLNSSISISMSSFLHSIHFKF